MKRSPSGAGPVGAATPPPPCARVPRLPVLLVAGLLVSGTAIGQPSSTAAVDDRSTRSGTEAVRVESGSITRRQVVALGRDLLVEGTVEADASVLGGDATVTGEITGDLVVLDGSVTLADGARIGGDVVALGGAVVSRGQAVVEGRTVAYPNAPASLLALLEMPTLGSRRDLLATQLGLLLAWWLAGLLVVSLAPLPVLRIAGHVTHQPLRCFFIGLTAVLAAALGFLLLVAVAPAALTLPLVALVAFVAFGLKVMGTVALATALGRWITRGRSWPQDEVGAFLVGLAAAGAVKLVPVVGTVAWSSITLVGMGAALVEATRGGRRATAAGGATGVSH